MLQSLFYLRLASAEYVPDDGSMSQLLEMTKEFSREYSQHLDREKQQELRLACRVKNFLIATKQGAD